jgi:AsmA protein
MKRLKYLAFAVGGLAALVLAGIAYVAATFDANKLKGELVQIVKDKKQRTLKIEGDLALSFWPSIGVRLGKTSLSEYKSEQVFAALDSAHVSVAVLPLLRKQVVVDTIELSGVKAALLRHKDGTLNIDDLLARDPKEPESVRFDIAGIKLANAQLGWRDEKTGQAFTLSALDLTTGRLANAAEGNLDLAARVKGDKPQSNAEIKVAGRYRYDLEQKQYGFSMLEARAKGDLAGIKGLDLVLSAGTLQLQPAKGEIALEGVSLSAKGKEGADTFEAKVDAPRLAVTADKASGSAMTAAVRLAGAQRSVDARLNLSGVEGSSQALRVAKLALDLDMKQGEATVKGTLQSPLAANLATEIIELPNLVGELNIAHPQMPMKSVKLPVAANARADLARQQAVAGLGTQFDESRITAKFNVSRFSPFSMAFDLDIDRLNMDKYFPPKPATAGEKKVESPLDFSALKGLNASGIIKIGQLQVANVKAGNVRLEVRAANGKLDLAPHSANLYNGSLTGALSINAHDNHVALKQTLTNVSINPLMKDALDKDLVEGRGNVVLDVSSSGASLGAMKKGLKGSAGVSLKDGALKGINLAQKFRESKALLSGRQDAVQQARQADKTDFSELSASFGIAGGVAHNEDLSMKSPFLRLGGAGDLNLGEGSMNYLAKASVVNTSGGQGAKELDHLKGLTVPVRISGPFESLSYKLEYSSLIAEAAKAKVEEKKQEVKEKAQEKLKEGLKGLFRK